MEGVISKSLFEKQKSSFDMLNRNWVFILLFSDIILPLLINNNKNNNNKNNNNNNVPETRKYWVDVQWGIVSSRGEWDPL